MKGKRPGHYKQECRNKIKWSEELSAKRAANRMKAEFGPDFCHYKCTYCRKFHVGSGK